LPRTGSIKPRHPFKNPRISATFGQDQQDRPGVAFTLLQDAGKAAFGVGAADQAADFDVRGQARLQVAQPASVAA